MDDLLVTTVEPADLEKMIEWQHRRDAHRPTSAAEVTEEKLVTRALPTRGLRSQQSSIRQATQELVAPVLLAWDMVLQIGGSTFKSGPKVEIEGRTTSLQIYGPRYDDEGGRCREP